MTKSGLHGAASLLTLALIGAAATPAFADSKTQALEKQVEELKRQLELVQAQIKDVKAASANQFAETQRQTAESPKVQLKDNRPTFVSGDGKFSVSLRGRFQFDYASYDQEPAGAANVDFRRGSFGDATEAQRARDLNSGTNFRRAQLGVEGKLTDDWNYALIYEFGGSGQEDGGRIQDLYVQYNGFNPIKIRAGAFAPSAGLEDSVSSTDTLFLERASASDLARQVAGADGRTGIAAFGNGEEWFASLALTGSPIGSLSTYDEQGAVVGRVAGLVVKSPDLNIHLGANATYLFQAGDAGPDTAIGSRYNLRLRDRPEVRVDVTRLIDTGNINTDTLFIPGLEAAANFQNFFIQGEHFWYEFERANSTLSDPEFKGWYVQASWILTGESRPWNAATGSFGAPRPSEPLTFSGSGWGAWELAARYSVADLNYEENSPTVAERIRGGEQTTWTAGLNWYVNNNVRFLLDYQWIEVDRLSTGAANAYGTGVFVPPAGSQIGQDLQVVSLRTQFTF